MTGRELVTEHLSHRNESEYVSMDQYAGPRGDPANSRTKEKRQEPCLPLKPQILSRK